MGEPGAAGPAALADAAALSGDRASPGSDRGWWGAHNVSLGGHCARSIEKSLQQLKDRGWDEDHHDTRPPDKEEAMATLRNAAISLLYLVPMFDQDEPIRTRADRLNRDPDLAFELFTAPF